MPKSKTVTEIVVGVDGSPASMFAVRFAARDAMLRNVPLTLVHVRNATAVDDVLKIRPVATESPAQFSTGTDRSGAAVSVRG